MPTDNYDSIPVFYCKRCKSLLILSDPEVGDYCQTCGSTEIGTALIDQYLKLTKKDKQL
jgi:hypothetical protein